jgi:hypothetical protein
MPARQLKPEPVIAKMSQETLVEMIGTTRSRVSFFMNKIRKLSFIDYNGELHVHSSDGASADPRRKVAFCQCPSHYQ